MSFESALRTRAKSGAVMAIAKSVEWAKRPEGGGFPAVVMQVVYAERAQTMTGFQAKRYARVQIDVMALDGPTKVALREAVIASLANRATADGVAFERIRNVSINDLSEQNDTQFVHRDAIDATFWYRELEN